MSKPYRYTCTIASAIVGTTGMMTTSSKEDDGGVVQLLQYFKRNRILCQIVHKIKSTPNIVPKALFIASHVQSNYIDHDILHQLMQRMRYHIREEKLMNKILPIAAVEGILTVTI